jgi:hypothetical protein
MNAKVFISHSTDEEELANCLTNWLEFSLTDTKVFCSSRPGELAAEKWRERIHEAGFKCDIFISLLSHESALKPWIHFEAGLATADGHAKIVPAIYGGLQKGDVPSTLRFAQILDLTKEEFFNASFLKMVKEYQLLELFCVP